MPNRHSRFSKLEYISVNQGVMCKTVMGRIGTADAYQCTRRFSKCNGATGKVFVNMGLKNVGNGQTVGVGT